jgi:dTDP-4-dehydrorhamnose reductase
VTALPRVLVVGGTGMLGHKLGQVLGEDEGLEVYATVRRPLPEAFRHPKIRYIGGVDLSGSTRSLSPLLDELRPDVVVNAVGAIKQKDLYSAPDESFFLNGSLPHMLALLNPNPVGKVIHFSTDCVFQGDRGCYRDDEAPDALDLYGRSKACGEVGWGRHLTLRTSIIGFEVHGGLGLVSWFLNQPRGSELRGFSRAIYSGLPTVTLARTVADLIRRQPELHGVWNVASEPIDKLDLLRRLNERLGVGHTLHPDASLVIDRSLDDSAFREATDSRRPGWDELIEQLAADFISLPYRGLYRAFQTDTPAELLSR